MMSRFPVVLLLYSIVLAPGCKPAAVSPVPPNAPAYSIINLTLDSPGGPCRGKLVAPASGAGDSTQRPGLLLIHEDHGLTDWELDQARKLVDEGYIVFAVDLYGGQKVESVMDAHIMGRALPEDLVLATSKTAVDYLAHDPRVRADRIGVIGWDIGGGYALDAARADSRLHACVVCYGRVVTDPALLKSLQAPVLGIFAGKDIGITQETLDAFQKSLKQADKKGTVMVMAKSSHGFMNPASTEAGGAADPEASSVAWAAIRSFLATELKKP